MIYTAGGKRQLIAWHTEAIAGLDPATGKTYWSQAFPDGEPERPGIRSRAAAGERPVVCQLTASRFIDVATRQGQTGCRGRGKARAARSGVRWLALADGAMPVLQGGHVYGVCNFGELRC